MRKQILAILVAIAMCGILVPMAGAADPQITITISGYGVAAIDCVDPADGTPVTTWNGGGAQIGGLEVNTSKTTFASINNTGYVPVHVTVAVADPTTWTSGSVAAPNVYVIKFYTAEDAGTVITTGGVDFKDPMAYAGSQKFGLGLQLPTTSTISSAQEIVVTFSATVA